MESRIRISMSLKTWSTAEDLRQALLAELAVMKPKIAVELLTQPKAAGKPPVLDIAVERVDDTVLLTVTQDAPSAFTIGHHVALLGFCIFFAVILSPWVALILFAIVHLGQHMLDADAPFTEEQFNMALKNLKERVGSARQLGLAASGAKSMWNTPST